MNASKIGLVGGKEYDTEIGSKYPAVNPKTRDQADIMTQNNSSILRITPTKNGITNTGSKPLNHEDIQFEVMEYDENDMKSLHSYKPQIASKFGSGLGKRRKNKDDLNLNSRSKTNIKPKDVPGRIIGIKDDNSSLRLGSVDEESDDEEESEDEEDLNMKPVRNQ